MVSQQGALWDSMAVDATVAVEEQTTEVTAQWGNEGQFLFCNTQFVSCKWSQCPFCVLRTWIEKPVQKQDGQAGSALHTLWGAVVGEGTPAGIVLKVAVAAQSAVVAGHWQWCGWRR